MDSTIMFVCKYGLQILPVRLSGGGRLKDVLSSICNRWNNLFVRRFSVSYAYEDGYCALQNESDFENMLFLFSNCDRINAKVDENKHSSRLIVGSTIDEVGDVDEVVDDEFEYVDKMDPAKKYSKHAETRYLTEAWANLIEGVGQEFPKGVKEFRGVSARYAIENGFMYRLVKNDQLRVTTVCVIERCEWHVHAIVNRTNGVFHIKKCHNQHNCGSTYRTNKHKRVSSSLVADEIAGIVEKKPKTSPVDMLDWFTDKYGLDLCYHSAWLGVEKARGGLYGDYADSFDRLRWYVEGSTGFMCRHAAMVIIKACGGEGNLVDHIDPLYLVDAYRRAYEEAIYPVVESDIPDFTKEGDRVIKPPRNKRPAGRPKVKRVRSRGEESYTRPNKCGRCHKASKHNQRTCKEPSNI
ncbi:hypothetical protein RHMOL_Rhmol11G0070800 [Rhododendron molle]|uniref:Uncharacterized protein n=1 Tax=Rhododendron molle TaxID=49168 RepID=A0ACC0LP70_RHOML|nr:hypothetical protein RHMOL_Rhmol11G0070800 [Rhododendron molle]